MRRDAKFFHFGVWSLIGLSTLVRFMAPLAANPLSSISMGAPLVQWHNATAPLEANPLTAMDPLFYPIWLGIIAKITLGMPLAIGIYSGLLSALTPWAWYRFLREALPSKDTALV